MKITILITGDKSVGIPDGEVSIEDKGMTVSTIAEREELRELYRDFYADLYQSRVGVFFEDECVDCGANINKGQFCPRCESLIPEK